MRYITKIFILLCSVIIFSNLSFAQSKDSLKKSESNSIKFGLFSSAGYGIISNSKLTDYTLVNFSTNFSQRIKVDNFEAALVENLFISDSSQTMFNGFQFGYRFWQKDSKSISFNGQALIGFEGAKLFGGGLSYDTGDLGVDVNLYQEHKSKQFWGTVNMRYAIVQF